MATMKDVARDAGVALGTVSKVVNGIYVRDEYRKRVEASIEKLGYEVNYYARGLKTQNTNTVAVIVPDILNPFFAAFVYYSEKELYRQGYKIYLCHSQGDAEKEAAYMKLVGQNKVDGIIGITYNETDSYVSKELPLVTLDRHFKESVCCVSSDNYQGGRLAASVLIEKGCKNLVYIRTGSRIHSETQKRRQGFEDFCKEQGMRYEVLDLGEDRDDNHEQEIKGFLKAHIEENGALSFDGIFAGTDGMAETIRDLLYSLKLKVPQDVQLIGYDGIQKRPGGPYMVSSIAQPIELLAQKCVESVLKLIRKEKVEPQYILPVKFVEGGTTL